MRSRILSASFVLAIAFLLYVGVPGRVLLECHLPPDGPVNFDIRYFPFLGHTFDSRFLCSLALYNKFVIAVKCPLPGIQRQRMANPPSPVRIREGPISPHESSSAPEQSYFLSAFKIGIAIEW